MMIYILAAVEAYDLVMNNCLQYFHSHLMTTNALLESAWASGYNVCGIIGHKCLLNRIPASNGGFPL